MWIDCIFGSQRKRKVSSMVLRQTHIAPSAIDHCDRKAIRINADGQTTALRTAAIILNECGVALGIVIARTLAAATLRLRMKISGRSFRSNRRFVTVGPFGKAPGVNAAPGLFLF